MSKIIKQALTILEQRLRYTETSFTRSQDTLNYLRLKLGGEEREVFAVLYLTTQHELIAYQVLFQGTVNASVVYVREIIKAALAHNAAALICAHNHPSGHCEPSSADIQITNRIKEAAELMEMKLLDHIIVSTHSTLSLAEKGYL